LERKTVYFTLLWWELNAIGLSITREKINEHGFEIFDFEFPTESYEKAHRFIDIDLGHSLTTNAIILDFYTMIIERNKIYQYRYTVKNNHIEAQDFDKIKTFSTLQ
jgi:hypothetical protein